MADIAHVIETTRSDLSFMVTICGTDENIESDEISTTGLSSRCAGEHWLLNWKRGLYDDRPDPGAPGG